MSELTSYKKLEETDSGVPESSCSSGVQATQDLEEETSFTNGLTTQLPSGLGSMPNLVNSTSMPNIANSEASSNQSLVRKKLPPLSSRLRLHLWQRVRFILGLTSVDGIRFMSTGYPVGRIVLWLVLLLCSITAMTWVLWSISTDYLARNTFFAKQKRFVSHIDFPAVTICNHNPYYDTELFDTTRPIEEQVAIYYEYFRKDRSYHLTTAQLIERLEGAFNITHQNFNKSVTIETILRQFGHRLEYGLTECSFDGEECRIENFTEVITAYGLCYTLNLDNQWNLAHAGSSHALRLLVDIEQSKYMEMTSHTAGLQVFIHPPDEYPYSGEFNGFSVSPGFETQIEISRTNSKFLEPPYGQCEDKAIHDPNILQNDQALQNTTYSKITRYTRQRCLDECEARYQERMCGCKADYLPITSIKVCDLNMLFKCLLNATDQFAASRRDLCDCPIECNQIKYATKMSQALYPALSNHPQYETRFYRRYFNYFASSALASGIDNALLVIYYGQLAYTEVTEEAEFSTFKYLADFGSHMGLFTGAGFLTVFELLEICF